MTRYVLENLGQVGQNLVYSKDVNAFFSTAVSSATAIAEIARSKDLSEEELARVNQELGRIRDYTIPLAPAPSPCPPAPGCAPCPACGAPAESAPNYLLVGAVLVGGIALGALAF